MTLGAYGRNDHRIHPDLDEWVVRRVLAGMHPKALVAAAGGAVSLRTAYRWKHDIVGVEQVQVGEYRASYVLRRDAPPTRITAWESKPVVLAVSRLSGIRCGLWMPFNREFCARFSGHRTNCKSRAALENAASIERSRRAA